MTATAPPTGRARARELWCRTCGYGIVIRHAPPACPMCHGTDWNERLRAAAEGNGLGQLSAESRPARLAAQLTQRVSSTYHERQMRHR